MSVRSSWGNRCKFIRDQDERPFVKRSTLEIRSVIRKRDALVGNPAVTVRTVADTQLK